MIPYQTRYNHCRDFEMRVTRSIDTVYRPFSELSLSILKRGRFNGELQTNQL